MPRPQDRPINLRDGPFSNASIRTNRNSASRAPVDDREVANRLQQSERDDFERARQLQMEEDRKALEELRAMQGHDTGFECKICLDMWSLGNVAKVDECEHEICRGCMKSHIEAELDHKRWPILCPLCKAENQKSPGGEHDNIFFDSGIEQSASVIYRHVAELVGADEEMITAWDAVELAVVSVLIECPSCVPYSWYWAILSSFICADVRRPPTSVLRTSRKWRCYTVPTNVVHTGVRSVRSWQIGVNDTPAMATQSLNDGVMRTKTLNFAQACQLFFIDHGSHLVLRLQNAHSAY